MKLPYFVAGAVAALLLVPAPLALAQSAPQSNTAASPPRAVITSRVEQRIKRLRELLKITPSEELQWTAVAQAMREDAETVGALIRKRRENAAKMNAVEDLRTYEAIAEAHAKGVARLASAFEALYTVMPLAQQKNADEVFRQAMHRRAARHRAK